MIEHIIPQNSRYELQIFEYLDLREMNQVKMEDAT